jgi:hypothetical protein
MDFVEGLPRVNGKSVVLTVVDRFSKYAHFVPLGHPYTTTSVAKVFFEAIVCLHGLSESIVSDRDPVFTSKFWTELFSLSGVKLQLSSAFHPQSDEQSEVVNNIITMYLRCLVGDRPRQWLKWLPWAEYCYNTAFQSSIRTSPFRVVYGREPPSLRPAAAEEARVPAVHEQLWERDEFVLEIRERLEHAQQRYKGFYDRKHREVEFAVGDWVWLRLIHRPLASLDVRGRGKLGPKFYGPFRVLEKIGDVAYRLQLPAGTKLHDVFHVGLLKRYKGEPPVEPPVLPHISHGQACGQPEVVIRGRLARGRREVLVQWRGQPAAEATWIDLEEFQKLYPDFQLEDELLVEGGRDVMLGVQYTRRNRRKHGLEEGKAGGN